MDNALNKFDELQKQLKELDARLEADHEFEMNINNPQREIGPIDNDKY